MTGSVVQPISPDVENIECSNRGQCNRQTGRCECFQGYFGIACHREFLPRPRRAPLLARRGGSSLPIDIHPCTPTSPSSSPSRVQAKPC